MTDSTNQADNESGVNFAALILGFSSAALHYMGEAPLGASEQDSEDSKNLELARQNIEIVQMLKLKTEGNLTGDEAGLISQVLADLQLKYASASK